ncbi:hypothetical protein HZS_5812 [Henneguya salminicola]|nr:hypothetical protein HZS_5812 [Henneguya salminicola]
MVVNFTSLREFYSDKIIDILTKCNGRKMLVLDKGLTTLNLIVNYSLFEKNQAGKVCFLEPGAYPKCTDISHILFLIRPIPSNITIIDDFIKMFPLL